MIFDPKEVAQRWPGIPPLILDSLSRYFNEHRPTGGFLAHALQNDFAMAVMAADPDSLAALRSIAGALSEAPGRAWGSPLHVTRWLATGHAALERRG
jgi:hypothetical protein